jgi:hypothetical protein
VRLSVSFASMNTSHGTDELLWLLKQEGATTDYVRVKPFSENSFFVGVPVEFRYFLQRTPRIVQPYFKLSALANFRFATATNVETSSKAMSKYEKDIAAQIEPDGIFSMIVYPGFGIKIGRKCNPLANIEMQVPFFVSGAKSVSSLITPHTALNINFAMQLPF